MRFCATIMLLFGLISLAVDGNAQESQPNEQQVKAAFVFNFSKFVEWPAERFPAANTPLCIGVMNRPAVLAEIQIAVRGKNVRSREITIVDCRSAEEAKRCHVLFIGAGDKRRTNEVLGEIAGTSVLTVGESDGFIESGGIINFYRDGKKFKFEINDEAARKVGLRINSQLLELGRKPAR